MVVALPGKFHLLPTEELPAELGELLNSNRPMAGRVQESARADTKAVVGAECPSGECLAERQNRTLVLQPPPDIAFGSLWRDVQDFTFLSFNCNKRED